MLVAVRRRRNDSIAKKLRAIKKEKQNQPKISHSKQHRNLSKVIFRKSCKSKHQEKNAKFSNKAKERAKRPIFADKLSHLKTERYANG